MRKINLQSKKVILHHSILYLAYTSIQDYVTLSQSPQKLQLNLINFTKQTFYGKTQEKIILVGVQLQIKIFTVNCQNHFKTSFVDVSA